MMNIDEAISDNLRIAEGQNKCAEISVSEHAKERMKVCEDKHRQLAEWLRELKKAKRILKDALIALNDGSCNKDCRKCVHNSDGCDYSCRFKWKHTDEVIKLIGGDDECI